MYKKIGLLLVLFCSCFLISCRVTRQEVKKTETQNQTTSEKLVTYKDTIIIAPKSETSLKIPINDLVFKDNFRLPIARCRLECADASWIATAAAPHP